MANRPKIVFYSRGTFKAGQPWAVPHIRAFAIGLDRHGIDLDYFHGECDPNKYDIAVMWGGRFVRERQQMIDAGKDYLIMERGYFNDRFAWTSIGWNGLNGEADFNNHNMPWDRWNAIGAKLGLWKDGGEYVLVTGQVPGDMSVQGMNLNRQYADIAEKIRKHTDLPIVFKPHPLRPEMAGPEGCRVFRGSMDDALKRAALCVTINSNSAVDAVLAGVPTITLDKKSMAWDVTSHTIDGKNVKSPYKPQRYQWAANLAYTQWTLDEMREGLPWEHLTSGGKYAKRAA